MNHEKVSSYGTLLFGFLSSALLAVGVLTIQGLKEDVKQVGLTAKNNFERLEAVTQVNFDKIDVQLSNHLAHHQQFDKEIFERLATIETKIEK